MFGRGAGPFGLSWLRLAALVLTSGSVRVFPLRGLRSVMARRHYVCRRLRKHLASRTIGLGAALPSGVRTVRTGPF